MYRISAIIVVLLAVLLGCSEPDEGPSSIYFEETDSGSDSDTRDDDDPPGRVDLEPDSRNPDCVAEPLPESEFDPDCVYLLGTMTPGTTGSGAAVVLSSSGKRVHTRFDKPSKPVIHSDGRLIYYTYGEGLFSYLSDGVWYPSDEPSPSGPEANDTPLSVPCTGEPSSILYMVAGPGGTMGYTCMGGRSGFYNGDGEFLAETGVALSPDLHVLTLDTTILKDGVETTVVDSGLAQEVVTARWSDDHFAVVQRTIHSPIEMTLWSVKTDGSAELQGTYMGTKFSECRLDSRLNLFCIVPGANGPDQVVVYSFDAPPVVVHDEDEHPVKIHGSALFTGP